MEFFKGVGGHIAALQSHKMIFHKERVSPFCVPIHLLPIWCICYAHIQCYQLSVRLNFVSFISKVIVKWNVNIGKYLCALQCHTKVDTTAPSISQKRPTLSPLNLLSDRDACVPSPTRILFLTRYWMETHVSPISEKRELGIKAGLRAIKLNALMTTSELSVCRD